MRDFFKQELKTLELKTGLRQYERLLERASWEDDLNNLVDMLAKVCDNFPYIPEESKKEIIQNNIISEQDLTGLNPRIIFKWLSQAKGIYFKEAAHKESQPEAPPVTGPEREEWIRKWNEALGNFGKIGKKDVKEEDGYNLREWLKEKPAAPIEREFVSEEERELHRQYVRENYHLHTGKPLETWVSEEKWILKQKADANQATRQEP